MKKYFKLMTQKTTLLLLAIPLITIGCSTFSNDKEPEVVDNRVANARHAIDWTGTYQGMLPCAAGCEGLATMLVLYPDNRYTLRTRKIGQDIKDNIKDGNFRWMPDDSQIQLSSQSTDGVIDLLRVDRGQLMLMNPAGALIVDNQGEPLSLEKTGGIPAPQPTI